jgi:hypothetical protein
VIKPKNGLRPKNRGKQKQNRGRGAAAEPTKIMDLWTRITNCFTEVCVESYILFILKPQPPQGFALRSPAAAAAVCRAYFLLAPGRRRRKKKQENSENRPRKKTKKALYIALALLGFSP